MADGIFPVEAPTLVSVFILLMFTVSGLVVSCCLMRRGGGVVDRQSVNQEDTNGLLVDPQIQESAA